MKRELGPHLRQTPVVRTYDRQPRYLDGFWAFFFAALALMLMVGLFWLVAAWLGLAVATLVVDPGNPWAWAAIMVIVSIFIGFGRATYRSTH